MLLFIEKRPDADSDELHRVCRQSHPPEQASRKQTNHLMLVIRKCVNKSSLTPICQSLNYDFKVPTKGVERWCLVVSASALNLIIPTSLSLNIGSQRGIGRFSGFQTLPRQPLTPQAPTALTIRTPGRGEGGPHPWTAACSSTSSVAETPATSKDAPAPPGATFFFRKIANTGETAVCK